MNRLSRILGTLALGLLFGCAGEKPEPLVGNGEDALIVMDFSVAKPLHPLPNDWVKNEFFTRVPMKYSFGTYQGVPAMRFETDNSASMLGRDLDIDLAQYPILTWKWLVEVPITSTVSEKLPEGDDHPARLLVTLKTAKGEPRAFEIIWGNKEFRAGQYKVIGDFHHYTANGGDPKLVGRWFEERLDLREIYRKIWKDGEQPRLTHIAVFCDSDETDTRSVAWFSHITLRTR
ncbi:DUF3047 domain-containing protein [Candidatus Spongiihabitans sp.]|uniref:DUF3047 domain-containing protein n=1 Tax=Candidatus Spongiihabitans sp. TaxID=3101308 RepID=UPI003C7DC844